MNANATSWVPLRKILAAAITALIAGGGLIGLIAGTGDVGWRELAAVAAAAALPVIVGYLVPSAPGEAAPAPVVALRAGEPPY